MTTFNNDVCEVVTTIATVSHQVESTNNLEHNQNNQTTSILNVAQQQQITPTTIVIGSTSQVSTPVQQHHNNQQQHQSQSTPSSSSQHQQPNQVPPPTVSCSIANAQTQVTKRKETLEAKRERKAAKTLAIITGAFVICWLPFFLMALLLPLCESCSINDSVASFFLWLGYFNSTLNPVIYTIFSPEFRQAFKRILFGAHRSSTYYRGSRF